MSEPCRIKQGIFERYFIQHPNNITKAWSGSNWQPASTDGYPTGMYQICNFFTEQEAREYCKEYGLEPVE